MAASLLGILLCAGATVQTGCAGNGVASRSSTSDSSGQHARRDPSARMDPTHRYLATDEDADQDDNGDPRYYLKPSMQDTFIPPWEGAEASRSDRLAIASLVKRYYAAAAAEDGAQACAMLSADIVAGLSAQPRSSSSPTRQSACAVALSRVYKTQHRLLGEDDVSTMVVADVRINRDVATAIVGFRTMPVGSVRLRREKGAWKIDAILDDRMLS